MVRKPRWQCRAGGNGGAVTVKKKIQRYPPLHRPFKIGFADTRGGWKNSSRLNRRRRRRRRPSSDQQVTYTDFGLDGNKKYRCRNFSAVVNRKRRQKKKKPCRPYDRLKSRLKETVSTAGKVNGSGLNNTGKGKTNGRGCNI